MQVTTIRGSTYVIGPSARRNFVHVSRLSDHEVAARDGRGGRLFSDDFTHVEVVSDGTHLRLVCTRESGRHLRTSPIAEVVDGEEALIDTQLPLTRAQRS